MTRNILLIVEYLGTDYFGFQIQNSRAKPYPSVQAAIERALKKLFKKKIRIAYASRTDRGVHAYEQGVNLKVDTKIPLKNIKRALNAFLPADIRVKRIKIVPLAFHARFSAKSKIYRYIILNKKECSVFWHPFSWHIDEPLDIERMKMAALKIKGRRDFSVFAKDVKRYRDCLREIKEVSIRKRNSFIYICIEADGFLMNMCRNIVSFLVKLGQGKIALSEVEPILAKRISYTNKPAPACGLYLWKVNY